MIEQWLRNQARTLSLLAVRAAFFENGAVHWDLEMVHTEDRENIHVLMLNDCQWKRRFDPAQAAHHTRNFVLAEVALVESHRRKQSPFTRKKLC